MTSAENSKAVFLLLLIHCLLLPPLFCVCVWGGGVGVMVGSCFIVHYLVSSFSVISLGKKMNWSLYFNCLLMSFDS